MQLLKSLLLFVAVVAVLLAVPLLLPAPSAPSAPVDAGPPWQIDGLPNGGSRVFGIELAHSTLDAVKRRHGDDVDVALLVAPGEAGAVEAYYERFTAGGVSGKLVLSLHTRQAEREAMLSRAPKAEYMEGTTRRVTLAAVDLAAMQSAPVMGVSFIPAANLDAAILLQRFGVPGERIRQGEQIEHFLYPDKGLDVALNSRGKALLQYVAPARFARLRDPLLARDGK